MSSSVPDLANATALTGRYAVELVALCVPDEIMQSKIAEDVSVCRLPLRTLRGLADAELFLALRARMKEAEILHIHGIWQQHTAVTSFIAKHYRIPVVVSVHGMLEPWAVNNKRFKKSLYSALFERGNLRNAQCLRALTRSEVDDYRRFGIRGPIAVIPNGVTPPNEVTPELFLSQFPQAEGRRLVMFLSRIHYKKGLDPLCRAWANICGKHPGAMLVLAGPDFEQTKVGLEALIRELGIEQSVFFPGMLAGALKWSALAACDLFVLPSYSEGFSMAILEAMSLSRPVLITEQCNFPEVAERQCGLVTQPSVAELTDALESLLSASPEVLHEMGRRGSSLVASQFSWPRIGQQMADVYDWISGGSRPSSVEIY